MALVSPLGGQALLELLREAKMPASSFCLCVPRVAPTDLMPLIEQAKNEFLAAFSVYPRIDEVELRVGRPACYLQIHLASTGDSRASAGVLTAGLDVWIAIMWIYLKWSRNIVEQCRA